MKYIQNARLSKPECDILDLEQGVYLFEVIRAEESVTKTQIDMLKLLLEIQSENKIYWLTDYIFANNPRQIDNFIKNANIVVENNDISPENCLGASGKVKLVLHNSRKYGLCMIVDEYINQIGEI